MSTRSERAAAATMAAESFGLSASGFSTRTCLLAARAASQCSRCASDGLVMKGDNFLEIQVFFYARFYLMLQVINLYLLATEAEVADAERAPGTTRLDHHRQL